MKTFRFTFSRTLSRIFNRGTFLDILAPILLALMLPAALTACGTFRRDAPAPSAAVSTAVDPLPTPAAVPPPSRTLDAYKADVARHIMDRNPERIFDGRLPPMLPAIVVLNITVDDQGQLTDVQVQRSRDPGASEVALASLRRSGPLPRPDGLMPRGAAMTFSETFLFGEQYRYQIRSLAGPQ